MVTLGDMVLIPAGPFAIGNGMKPVKPRMIDKVNAFVNRQPQPPLLDDDPYELPIHTVMVSAFYMDKYEVTKEKWDEVYNWAITNGYEFDNPGSGTAPDHPVHTVNWYDCVKWCNARSEKEGLTPCYYTTAAQTQICRIGQISLMNDCVNWATNGYRLPTEAEWEKAARGGMAGRRFPWGDTITHYQANYRSIAAIPYDKSWTRGYHPRFAGGPEPYTSPVGSFNPNGYGVYDMAGNVFEWCWDGYDGTYYASSPARDAKGPVSGSSRVIRGGGWFARANYCRSASRAGDTPDFTYNSATGSACPCPQVSHVERLRWPSGAGHLGTRNIVSSAKRHRKDLYQWTSNRADDTDCQAYGGSCTGVCHGMCQADRDNSQTSNDKCHGHRGRHGADSRRDIRHGQLHEAGEAKDDRQGDGVGEQATPAAAFGR